MAKQKHPWIGQTIRLKTNGHYETFAIKKVGDAMVTVSTGVRQLEIPRIQAELLLEQKK